MVAAVYSVVVWAGMLLLLLGLMALAGYVERATKSARGEGLWLHLVLLAHAVVVGLITTAVLYSLLSPTSGSTYGRDSTVKGSEAGEGR
jgi:hypothetical protein